jgi:hypothetical protein
VRAVSFTVGIDASSAEALKEHQQVSWGNTGVTPRQKLDDTARVRSKHILTANEKGFLRVVGFRPSQEVAGQTTKTRIRNQQVLGSIPSAGSNISKTCGRAPFRCVRLG